MKRKEYENIPEKPDWTAESIKQVEKIITSHSSVLECAVVGLQDYKWGEAVTCICALKPDASPSESLANEIREFCRGKLARFKVPKKVLFIDQLVIVLRRRL